MTLSRPSFSTARAFSLIELMTSVAVISVLIAILLPALAGARRAGAETRSLANVRSIAQTFAMYDAAEGALPFASWGYHRAPGTPGSFLVVFSGNSQTGEPDPWAISRNWPVVMHGVADWSEHGAIWMSPGTSRNQYADPTAGSSGEGSSYRYARAFLAPPAVWSGRGDASGLRPQATRIADVVFPSSKVLLYDGHVAYHREPEPPTRRPVALVDGSGRVAEDADAAAPVANALRPGEAASIYHDTPMGSAGRDF